MQSLDEYYQAHAPEIYRYLYSLCRRREVAEDILQETFYQAYHHLESFQGISLRPWLFRVARNAFIDHVRKESRTASKDPAYFQDTLQQPSFEGQLVAQERQKEVFRQIEGLPDKQKEALLLFAVHQLSYQDIAQVLSVSVASAKSLIFRARAALKAQSRDSG